MSTHKHFDKICCIVLALTLLLLLLFVNAEHFGIQKLSAAPGYEAALFDTSVVHSIDLVMDDWDGFLETCMTEEYALCSVVIDGEAYKNVGIRAKGNTSLTQVAAYGNDRYSFKIEFDHYDSSKSYHGLNQLCLNNIIQDNTYLKDYLTYQLMGEFGVSAPLCSFAQITVNGELWGLYLAVESVGEAFLQRNYGKDYGALYKPDSMDQGGGRGHGQEFRMIGWKEPDGELSGEDGMNPPEMPDGKMFGEDGMNPPGMPDGKMADGNTGNPSEMPDGKMFGGNTTNPTERPEGQMADGNTGHPPGMPGENLADGNAENPPGMPDGKMFGEDGANPPNMPGMGNSDVSLIYTDQEYDSYRNIFDNAKTKITDADKNRLIESLKCMNEAVALDRSVDIEAVIRYFVVHNFVLNFDSYTGAMIHNYYLYEKDGLLSMIPWDYNLAFGGFESNADAETLINYPIDSPVSGGTLESRPMLAWIFSDEEYTALYHTLFQEFLDEILESGRFEQRLDAVTELISPYVEQDPTKFCTFAEFETGAATLKRFCLLRAESIRGQLSGVIGSTQEAQADRAGFVEADGLAVSDMGSMHGAAGGTTPGAMPAPTP